MEENCNSKNKQNCLRLVIGTKKETKKDFPKALRKKFPADSLITKLQFLADSIEKDVTKIFSD